MFNQYRWYYNAILDVSSRVEGGDFKKKKYSFYSMRDLLRKYHFDEESRKFEHHEDLESFPIPSWWEDVHNRVIRGSVKKFTSSLNSAISNRSAGHNKGFKMSFLSRKSPNYLIHFEDKNFPKFLKKIPSMYWYRNDGGRTRISYNDLKSQRGLEVLWERTTNKYYFLVPVDRDWYPEDDRRRESQAVSTERVIALDPGVRKFLVGYDPEGEVVIIGKGAHKELKTLLLSIDKIEDPLKREKRWRKVKGKIKELHWKTARYLTTQYDTILLPDFRISQMIPRGTLTKMTKRLLTMFSFHSFKMTLSYMCEKDGKNLVIVDESYTSCTCTNCGLNKKLRGEETFRCSACGLVVDRDVNGARNIYLKNLKGTLA